MKNKKKYSELIRISKIIDESIGDFSNSLTDHSLLDLKSRLVYCAYSESQGIEEGISYNSRIDRLKIWIRINSTIQDCRDYLKMVQMMDYRSTHDLVKVLDEISRMLKDSFSINVSNIN